MLKQNEKNQRTLDGLATSPDPFKRFVTSKVSFNFILSTAVKGVAFVAVGLGFIFRADQFGQGCQ